MRCSGQRASIRMRMCGVYGRGQRVQVTVPDRDILLPDDIYVLLRHRLLLQPCSFEGCRSVRVVEDVDDPVVPNLGVRVDANVGLDSTGLTLGRYADRGDDAIALLDHLLQIDAVLVPGVEPLIPI